MYSETCNLRTVRRDNDEASFRITSWFKFGRKLGDGDRCHAEVGWNGGYMALADFNCGWPTEDQLWEAYLGKMAAVK